MKGRVLLILLTGAALGFRLWGLETQILWHDEIYTKFFVSGYRASEWKAALYSGQILDATDVLRFQENDPSRGFSATLQGLAHDEPQHPPLYYALLRLWISWFGSGTASIRLPSALLGALGIPTMYWLCMELFRSRRVSLFASALLAVSPLFVRYSQEAREYALWSMLIVASSAALFRALRTLRLQDWCIFAGLSTAALYTSLSTIPVMGAQALFVLLRERARFNRASLSAAAAFVSVLAAFSPWAALLWENFESFQASMAWSAQIVVARSQIFLTLAVSVSRPFFDFWNEPEGTGAWVSVIASAFLLSAGFSALRRAKRDARIFLLSLMLLPVSLLLLPDLVSGGIRSVSTRYLLPSLLGLAAAVSYWFGRKETSRLRLAAGAALICLCAINNIVNLHRPAWTKGISMSLPEIAEIVNRAEHPLVIGNMERHHPGNLIALCNLLKPGTKLQFLNHGVRYEDPRRYQVFLFSPIPPFLEDMQKRGFETRLLFSDLHSSLYIVERSPTSRSASTSPRRATALNSF